MKPTQKEIIEFAKQAKLGTALSHGGGDLRIFIEGADWHEELLRFAELLLEHFGAGGGEPVAYVCPSSHVTADGSMEDGPDYLEWADEASDYEKRVGTPLYAHPSPTDLRAEYLRGLEDAKKAFEAEADTWKAWPQAGAAKRKGVKAIEALKGKQ